MRRYNNFELHYFLADDSHSIDAFTRNKAEAELLAALKRTADLLGIECKFEAEALSEGGLREIWKAVGANSAQINILLIVATLVFTRLPPPQDPSQAALDKELTELSIEQKKLEIRKLKEQLDHGSDISNEKDEGDDTTANAVDLIVQDPQVAVRRSNFYSHIIDENKISGLEFSSFTDETSFRSGRIDRELFRLFILETKNLEPVIVEDAIIEIVSPVLREGRFRWKGIFDEERIGFDMHDYYFKAQVLNEDVTFQHGTVIECVLEISRKLDETGTIKITGYAVKTVISKHDQRQTFQTSQGRSYQEAKRLRTGQNDLFE